MRTWTLWMSGAMVLAVAAGLYAQVRPASDPLPPVSRAWGKVKSVDLEAKTLVIVGRTKRDEEPKDLTFSLAETTKVLRSAAEGPATAGTLADLKVDALVTILYRSAEDKLIALNITVREAAAK